MYKSQNRLDHRPLNEDVDMMLDLYLKQSEKLAEAAIIRLEENDS